MERIVSLLPSSTETVFALGLGDLLVGRSHECDLPPEATRRPAVTAPRLDPAAPSAAIDAEVKALVARALSLYDVDVERLRLLAPDAILTQTQCEVCAVTPRDLEEALAEWTGARPTVVSLAPETLPDVLDDLVRVADALGVVGRGRQLRHERRARLDALAAETGPLAPHPRVACLEWTEPLMGAGNWVPELVEAAGGTPVLGEAGAHSPYSSLGALAEADPDAILVVPCGFDLPRTRRETESLAAEPAWASLRAVREGRVYLADGNRHFNRPGPRIVESAEILAEILHPGRFRFGHEASGWQHFVAKEPT